MCSIERLVIRSCEHLFPPFLGCLLLVSSEFSYGTFLHFVSGKTTAAGDRVVGSDGKPVRESNARLVKWKDGSYQLIVGDAVFNAYIKSNDSWCVRACAYYQSLVASQYVL